MSYTHKPYLVPDDREDNTDSLDRSYLLNLHLDNSRAVNAVRARNEVEEKSQCVFSSLVLQVSSGLQPLRN
jgi:hypothetical protein